MMTRRKMPGCTWSADVLRALPLLSEMTAAEFAWILPRVLRRAFAPRDCVLRSGETPEGLYIVVCGRVRVVHQDQEGRALIVETLGPGELLGEMGLIDAAPCPASVVAAESCELAFIPREAAVECIRMSHAAALTLLRTSLTRLCKAHRQMASLALTKVYGRVAQVLVTNGQEDNGEWHVSVGSEQIAAMVGASREMVSRVLKCMIEKRLVRRVKRKLIVIDRDALRAPAP